MDNDKDIIGTFTGGTFSVPENMQPVTADDIMSSMSKISTSFIDAFKGIPVRVDDSLTGGYYIAVSQSVYAELLLSEPDRDHKPSLVEQHLYAVLERDMAETRVREIKAALDHEQEVNALHG